MPDSIHTHSVGRGFAVSDEVILNESPRTRTVFRPALHGGGVRGHLIRQKRGADGTWADTNEVNFNQLPADCGVQIELDTSATDTLFSKLKSLYEVQHQGVVHGDHEFVVAEKDEVVVVSDQNKAAIIQALLDQQLSEEFWEALSATDPDLALRLAAGRIQYDREQTIGEFERALQEHTADEKFWQDFFELHPWILQTAFSSTVYYLGGEVYVGGKRPVGRQGTGGVATDFLFADDSTKSFAVVEIKTPHTKLIGGRYRGDADGGYDNETYSMHGDLTGGVVQTRNQMSVAIDNFESVLGPGFGNKLNRVHPKGVLIVGEIRELSERQLTSFNHFRHGLYSLTVITFDELLRRLRVLFNANEPESSGATAADATGGGDDIPF
jgi:Domain of unknown function (DUF4263)